MNLSIGRALDFIVTVSLHVFDVMKDTLPGLTALNVIICLPSPMYSSLTLSIGDPGGNGYSGGPLIRVDHTICTSQGCSKPAPSKQKRQGYCTVTVNVSPTFTDVLSISKLAGSQQSSEVES